MHAENEPSFSIFFKRRTVYKEFPVSGESLHLYREIYNHNTGIQIDNSLNSRGRLNSKRYEKEGEAAASTLTGNLFPDLHEIWKHCVDLWAIQLYRC